MDVFVNMVYFVNMIHETPSPRISARRAARREAILDAAEQLLDEHGLDAITQQALAARLDWTVGALYRYFPSKDAILEALAGRVLDAYADGIEAAMARVHEGEAHAPLVRVILGCRAYVAHSVARRAHFRLAHTLMVVPQVLLPPAERAVAMAPVYRVLGAVGTALADGRSDGDLTLDGSPAQATVVLWSGLTGALQMSKLGAQDPHLVPADALPERMLRTLLAAWACPATLDAALRRADVLSKEAA